MRQLVCFATAERGAPDASGLSEGAPPTVLLATRLDGTNLTVQRRRGSFQSKGQYTCVDIDRYAVEMCRKATPGFISPCIFPVYNTVQMRDSLS